MSEWEIELSYVIRFKTSAESDNEIDAIKKAKNIIKDKTRDFSKLNSIVQSDLEFNSVVYANKKD